MKIGTLFHQNKTLPMPWTANPSLVEQLREFKSKWLGFTHRWQTGWSSGRMCSTPELWSFLFLPYPRREIKVNDNNPWNGYELKRNIANLRLLDGYFTV